MNKTETRILKLREQFMTATEIAKEVNKSVLFVRQTLHKAGDSLYKHPELVVGSNTVAEGGGE